MELGMVGFGRTGSNMVRRLLNGGHRVVVCDPIKAAVETMIEQGAVAANSLADLAQRLTMPRAIWLMVPSGEPTEDTVNTLADVLSPGDIIIDGGDSSYKDSIRRAEALSHRGLLFLDVGTSGGIWGLTEKGTV